ncbi:MAG: type III-B CRISPR module-associated protein Cmr3 [Planctomycetaceae bacterium]|jgi:CRISPR-associated protein Cmr3|nr:type III-B CRISPR module-associated protein Cmr3 [Planctomycetaceae bacterium]
MPEIMITPRDPVIARDGRPFGAGQRMKSLDWIYPSVLAGSLRTMLGKQCAYTFNEQEIETLKKIEFTGPLPFTKEKLYFPKPLDCVVKKNDNDENNGTVYSARPQPLKENEGCNLPGGLQPVFLPDEAGGDFKPKKTAPFWSSEKLLHWLAQEQENGKEFNDDDTLQTLPQEERVHVKIEPATGASEPKMLFSTTGLDFSNVQIAVKINVPDELIAAAEKLNAFHPLGGERRLVHWKSAGENNTQTVFPAVPSFADTKRLRMVLATPAIFAYDRHGWLPDWLDAETFSGTLPNGDVKVKLAGAVIDRWLPLSGWSYAKVQRRGPKDVRRLVPAGSVYFFEIQSGTLQDAVNANWLKNICGGPQNNRDGFGLALWGIW